MSDVTYTRLEIYNLIYTNTMVRRKALIDIVFSTFDVNYESTQANILAVTETEYYYNNQEDIESEILLSYDNYIKEIS